MNRADELSQLLEHLSKVQDKDLEKEAAQLIKSLENLSIGQYMLLMKVLEVIGRKYRVIK